MNLRANALRALFLAGGLFGASSAQAVFVLPSGYVTYGDAQSYALQVSGVLAGCTSPGCPYYVNSTVGAIKDLTVVATGASGNPVNQNYAGANDAFSTPSGTQKDPEKSDPYFETGVTVADPGGTFAYNYNNLGKSWDVELGSLRTFLSGEDMVIFFNNNQVNSGPDTNQTLAAWAVLWLTGPNGVIEAGSIFEFTNRGAMYGGPGIGGGILSTINPNAAQAFTSSVTDPLNDRPRTNIGNVPTANLRQICFNTGTQTVTYQGLETGCQSGERFLGTTELTDYVLSGGPVCINSAETAIVPCGTTGSKTVNNNLGANQAAYALLFPELNGRLNTLFADGSIADLNQYSLHIRVLLGCDPIYQADPGLCTAKTLNNGYEQIFISTASRVVQVPEPASLGLLALGFFGLAGMVRRASRRATSGL